MIRHPFIITDTPLPWPSPAQQVIPRDPREAAVAQRLAEPHVPSHLLALDSVARARQAQREQRADSLLRVWLPHHEGFRHWFLTFYDDDPLILMALAALDLRAYARACRLLRERNG